MSDESKQDDRWFGHSGDFGDIIYALPAIRALGGGVLYLYDTKGRTAHGMSPERAASIIPLLQQQSYLREVRYLEAGPPHGQDSPLNLFRRHLNRDTLLTDGHLRIYALPVTHRQSAWLHVTPTPVASVVIARSARYHNPKFPWPRVLDQYRSRAVFVGTKQEHDSFTNAFGAIPHQPTRDMLELAQVVAGSDLFIGNQSSPAAVAEGLKHAIIMEVCTSCPNCSFNRMCRINVSAEDVEFPPLYDRAPLVEAKNGTPFFGTVDVSERQVAHAGV